MSAAPVTQQRTLRVLHVIASMSPKHGGPTDAILRIHPQLQRLGIECLVASTSDDLDNQLDVPHGRPVDFLGAKAVFFPNTFRTPRRLRDFAFSPPMHRWLQENIRTFDVLHVHALFSFATSRAMAIACRDGVPFISRPLGVLGKWAMQHGAWHKKMFLALCERRLLNHAAAIEYNSDLERDEAAALGISAPARVIPLGFEPVPDAPDARASFCQQHHIDSTRLLVIFLGRIDPKKGLEFLLQACASLPRDSFHLIIAGAGQIEYEAAMKQRIRDLQMESSTVWAGFLQGDAKTLALRAADVFVLPSHSESFGIAVAEAMSAGCAIITTTAVPLASLVSKHDAGWIVSPEASSVAAALREAQKDSQRTSARGRNAAQIARSSLSYEAVAPQLASLYRDIARKAFVGEVRNLS